MDNPSSTTSNGLSAISVARTLPRAAGAALPSLPVFANAVPVLNPASPALIFIAGGIARYGSSSAIPLVYGGSLYKSSRISLCSLPEGVKSANGS